MEISYDIIPAPNGLDGYEIAWLSPTFGKRVSVMVSNEELSIASKGGKIPASDESGILKALAAGIDSHRLESTHVLQRHNKAVLQFREGRCDPGGANLVPWKAELHAAPPAH